MISRRKFLQGSIGLLLQTSQNFALATTVYTQYGTKKTLQSFHKKNQGLLVNLWSYWCQPCIEEVPKMNEFFQRDINILGLCVMETNTFNVHTEEWLEYQTIKTSTTTRYPQALLYKPERKDFENKTEPIQRIPAFYLFNRQGKFVHAQRGTILLEENAKSLEDALSKI